MTTSGRGGGRERFLARAAELGVEIETRAYPAGTHTAQDAAEAIGCDVAQIVKSLVFEAVDADGTRRPILVLVSGADRVDLQRLTEAAGAARIRRPDADAVREATGYAIGGIPPFGHDTPLPTYLDAELLRHDVVWAAAGTPRDNAAFSPGELRRLTDAAVVSVRMQD